ncbi:hypothetical protein ACHAPF_011112 [Botrytis cinerea]
MSHHANDATEPWDYDWTAGLEAIIPAISASLKDDTRFERYLYESRIAEEKKGAPLEIEEMKAIRQKSKDDLEHELGVERILNKEFKNAGFKEMKVENKEANKKAGEWGSGEINTIASGAMVSSKGAANEVTNLLIGNNIHSDPMTSNVTKEDNFTE